MNKHIRTIIEEQAFDFYLKNRYKHTINLDVTYDEKDRIKKYGAAYDPIKKVWFIDVKYLADKDYKFQELIKFYVNKESLEYFKKHYLNDWNPEYNYEFDYYKTEEFYQLGPIFLTEE